MSAKDEFSVTKLQQGFKESWTELNISESDELDLCKFRQLHPGGSRDHLLQLQQGSSKAGLQTPQAFMQELAGCKPLQLLASSVPAGMQGQHLIESLISHRVPVERAAWLVQSVYVRAGLLPDAVGWTSAYVAAIKKQLTDLHLPEQAGLVPAEAVQGSSFMSMCTALLLASREDWLYLLQLGIATHRLAVIQPADLCRELCSLIEPDGRPEKGLLLPLLQMCIQAPGLPHMRALGLARAIMSALNALHPTGDDSSPSSRVRNGYCMLDMHEAGAMQALDKGMASGAVEQTLTAFKAAVGSCNGRNALSEHVRLICTWGCTAPVAQTSQALGQASAAPLPQTSDGLLPLATGLHDSSGGGPADADSRGWAAVLQGQPAPPQALQPGSSSSPEGARRLLRLKAVQKLAKGVLHIETPASRPEDGAVVQLLGHAMRLRPWERCCFAKWLVAQSAKRDMPIASVETSSLHGASDLLCTQTIRIVMLLEATGAVDAAVQHLLNVLSEILSTAARSNLKG
ncbi:hypothetical protein WJX73_005838 [Symbiochloris irregularis]